MDSIIKYGLYACLPDLFPFIKNVPGDFFKRKLLLRNIQSNLETLGTYIDEHKQTYDENNIRDFIDCYIKELRSDKKKSKFFTGSIATLYILVLYECTGHK